MNLEDGAAKGRGGLVEVAEQLRKINAVMETKRELGSLRGRAVRHEGEWERQCGNSPDNRHPLARGHGTGKWAAFSWRFEPP